MTLNTALLAQLVSATAANSFIYTSTADHGPLVQAGFAQVNAAMVNPNGDGSLATRSTPEGAAYLATLSAPQGQPAAPATDFGVSPAELAARAAAASQGQPQPGHGIGQQSAGNFQRNSAFQPAPKTAKPRNTSGANDKYPFASLAAPTINADGSKNYDAFFVPSNTYGKDDKHGRAGQVRTSDDMAFSLQSACNAASRRMAEVLSEKQVTDSKGKVKTVKEYRYNAKFAVQGGVDGNGQPGAWIYREA